MDHCEVSSALHPEQNQQQLHGMFVQHLQLLKISSCGIRNQGFKRARIWWKSEHKTHTQAKSLFFSKLLWLFIFQKDRSFYHLIRRCKTDINPSPPATSKKKKKQKKNLFLFLSLSLSESFFFFLSVMGSRKSRERMGLFLCHKLRKKKWTSDTKDEVLQIF